MSWKKRMIRWLVSALLVGVSVIFVFVGPRLFAALGLPVWSDGDHGWNYVATVAFAIFTAGISVFNSTLSEKVRRWLWAAVAVLALALYYFSAYA